VKINDPIEIIKVGNGFMVRPARDDSKGCVTPMELITVYESMSNLISFVESQFDWPERKDPA
jgi:hypothetical protein